MCFLTVKFTDLEVGGIEICYR